MMWKITNDSGRLTLASLSNLSAVTKSFGRWILIPFFSAFSISSPTIVAPSSSKREEPICLSSVIETT